MCCERRKNYSPVRRWVTSLPHRWCLPVKVVYFCLLYAPHSAWQIKGNWSLGVKKNSPDRRTGCRRSATGSRVKCSHPLAEMWLPVPDLSPSPLSLTHTPSLVLSLPCAVPIPCRDPQLQGFGYVSLSFFHRQQRRRSSSDGLESRGGERERSKSLSK